MVISSSDSRMMHRMTLLYFTEKDVILGIYLHTKEMNYLKKIKWKINDGKLQNSSNLYYSTIKHRQLYISKLKFLASR